MKALLFLAVTTTGVDRDLVGAHDPFPFPPFHADGLWSPELERVCNKASPETQHQVFERVGLVGGERSCRGLVRAAHGTGETRIILGLMTTSVLTALTSSNKTPRRRGRPMPSPLLLVDFGSDAQETRPVDCASKEDENPIVLFWFVTLFLFGGWMGWTLASTRTARTSRQIQDVPCDVKIVTV